MVSVPNLELQYWYYFWCKFIGTWIYIYIAVAWLDIWDMCIVQVRNCRIPAVSSSDFTLHLIFLTAVIILFISGTFTVFGFISNHAKITNRLPRDTLSQEDIVVLVGGLTFFIAFIIALLTQIRASQSLYKLIVSCISSNTEWRIDPYRRSDDSLFHK